MDSFMRILFFCICCFSVLSRLLAAEPFSLALVMKSLSNPYFIEMERGAKIAADEYGVDLEIFGVERATDLEQQIDIMEGLIARHVDAIIIAPVDSKKLFPVCMKAIEQGITLINVDNPLCSEFQVLSDITIPFVGPDNRLGAYELGQYVAGAIGGTGDVAVIEGIRDAQNNEIRTKAFLDALGEHPAIRVVARRSANWHTDEAFGVTTEILQQHPGIKAILCANDNMAIGAVQAVEMAGKNRDIIITGYDNIDAVQALLKDKRMAATVEQHAHEMGRRGVETAYESLVEHTDVKGFPIPVDLITYDSFGCRVALLVSQQNNPFFSRMIHGAQQEAARHGIILQVLNAGDNRAHQLLDATKIIDEASAQCVILNPTDSTTGALIVELLAEHNLPVIVVDREVSNTNITSFIHADNIDGGALAARCMAKELKQGHIIEITGLPDTSAAMDRSFGFNNELNNYPVIQVTKRIAANFSREKSKGVMLDILKSGLPFDGIFAHNDTMILGCLDAFREWGYTAPCALIGFDGIPAVRTEIRAGTIHATIAQQPDIMGAAAIDNIATLLRGSTPAKRTSVPLKLITK